MWLFVYTVISWVCWVVGGCGDLVGFEVVVCGFARWHCFAGFVLLDLMTCVCC